MEKAGIQGYLTTDDLMEAVPDANTEQVRLLLSVLRHRGVDIVDPDEDAASDTESDTPEFDFPPSDVVTSEDTISLYLKEMSRVPLLAVDEELELAIRIENGRRAKKDRLKLNGRANAALRRSLDAVIQEGLLAREHLIKANTRLVVSVAKRYLNCGVPFLDLIQEGNLGLMKAVEKYDYKRGFRFSTYATWWIRQTITRAIADQARTIRLPVHMTDRIRQYYKASHTLEQELGRQPTVEEVAQALQMSTEKVKWILKVSWLPLSLESPVGEDDESELGHFIEDEFSPTPLQSAYQSMLKEKLEEVLASLPPREANILRLRFGLEDGNPYTLEEVGQKFGLTRERIRQIEGRALRRLRHPKQPHHLKDYL
ncbi:MAG: sigma-70 family RNA polymerase sigma factor [Chloroflexi bacterium]|nr:sigma-70 family RNA polymerase sigma factor [Chloroflexota bacterium]